MDGRHQLLKDKGFIYYNNNSLFFSLQGVCWAPHDVMQVCESQSPIQHVSNTDWRCWKYSFMSPRAQGWSNLCSAAPSAAPSRSGSSSSSPKSMNTCKAPQEKQPHYDLVLMVLRLLMGWLCFPYTQFLLLAYIFFSQQGICHFLYHTVKYISYTCSFLTHKWFNQHFSLRDQYQLVISGSYFKINSRIWTFWDSFAAIEHHLSFRNIPDISILNPHTCCKVCKDKLYSSSLEFCLAADQWRRHP